MNLTSLFYRNAENNCAVMLHWSYSIKDDFLLDDFCLVRYIGDIGKQITEEWFTIRVDQLMPY